eukprot:XP_011428727.1 PREDICTED: uncharacterized protein LOC105329234 [Crassostrea gigas]
MKRQDIFFTYPAAREPDGDETVYDIAMEQLDNYFRTRVNTPFERHGFRLMTLEPTESVDQFVTRLKQKAQHCNFDNADEHIRDQVIGKCKSSHLRRKLLERGEEYGINHETSTPYWPQANGEVERQNKTLLKAIRTAHVEEKDWRKELSKFLSAYRNTPHTVTGVAPNKLIFRYPVKTKIPSFPERDEEDIRVKDWIKKKKEKEYTDKSRNAKYSQVQGGDQVLVQQPKENKLSPAFETKPYEVVGRTGNEVLLKAPHGSTYPRNVKQVKNLEIDDSVPLDDADDVTDLDLPQSKLPDDGDDLKITDIDDDQKIERDRGDSVRTRPVRQHKLPDRFKDFVLT